MERIDCQDTTDLQKAMEYIQTQDTLDEKRQQENPTGEVCARIPIVVLGAIGGRFDQTMASVYVLHEYSPSRPVFLLDDHFENLSFLLEEVMDRRSIS